MHARVIPCPQIDRSQLYWLIPESLGAKPFGGIAGGAIWVAFLYLGCWLLSCSDLVGSPRCSTFLMMKELVVGVM